MKLHELYKRIDPKTDMLNSALAALHRRASSKGDLQSIDGYAFDIIRSYNIDIGAKELARLYREKHNIAEDEESVNEGYKLHLERDTDMMVLHIKDTATGKRTEVRGKPGYETNYDPNDSLHILLDKVGKSANISELMNGEVVTINPKHPDAERAKSATDRAFNESLDQPYPVRWNMQTDEEWFGWAKDDKMQIQIKIIADGRWVIRFKVNHTMDKTGEGDQFRIFATVKAAIQEWWTWASKNAEVNVITFSADKIVDSSRSKLYHRFAQQFARAIGYEMKVNPGRNDDIFYIEKPGVKENFADGKKKIQEAFNENVSALASELEAKYNLKSLFLGDMASRNAIELHSIIVNREDQGKGTGSKVMQELIKYADDNGKIMVLDPGLLDKKHGTTSQSRLRKFYKQFGFIDNKGRNKNYEFRNLMIRYPQSNESVTEVSKEEFDAIRNGYVDIEFDKKWWPLSSDYPLIKHIGEAIGATSWTSWGKVGVPWSETEMIGGGGTYMLKGDFGYILLDAAKTYRPDGITMAQISTSNRGDGVGAKVMNAIKQYTDKQKLPFTVYKVTNVPFFKKFSWLTQTDAGTFVYDPTKKVQEATVTEALDQPYPVRWVIRDDDEWEGKAKTEAGDSIQIMITQGYNNHKWEVDFYVGGSMQVTGKGDQFRIFATVVSAVKKWWSWLSKSKQPVEAISFSAFKGNKSAAGSTGRSSLYNRFATQFARSIGFTVSTVDGKDNIKFVLTNPNYKSQQTENFADSKNQINEVLDNPYSYSWVKKTDEYWQAEARTDSGAKLEITFEYFSHDAEWELFFEIDGNHKATAAGDEFRIFATVVSAIKEWWKSTSSEGLPVESIEFSADKLNNQTGKTGSREKLYNRFAQQFANSIGFIVQRGDTGNATNFKLVNLNYKNQQTENFANGKNPGRKEIAVHRSSEKFSNIDLSKSADGTFWLAAPDADWDNIVTTGKGVEHAYEISPTAKLASWDDIDKYSVDELEGMGYDGVRMVDGKDISYQIWNTDILTKTELAENFADGKKPGRKGLAKRSGVNTKASVSDLRKTAKNSSGEKQRMAHWLANMKAGKAKKK